MCVCVIVSGFLGMCKIVWISFEWLKFIHAIYVDFGSIGILLLDVSDRIFSIAICCWIDSKLYVVVVQWNPFLYEDITIFALPRQSLNSKVIQVNSVEWGWIKSK